VVLLGESANLGGVAVRLTPDTCDVVEVAGLLVDEADLRAGYPIGVAHPSDEVFSLAARREQREWSSTASLGHTHASHHPVAIAAAVKANDGIDSAKVITSLVDPLMVSVTYERGS
jgi:hypothetical protein